MTRTGEDEDEKWVEGEERSEESNITNHNYSLIKLTADCTHNIGSTSKACKDLTLSILEALGFRRRRRCRLIR